MKKYVLLILSLIFAMWAFGQKDQKAERILNELHKRIKEYSTIQVEFDFELKSAGGGVSDSNKGTVAIKGELYRLNMPILGMEIFSNGVTAWNYMSEAEEVSITEVDADDDGFLNPANIFTAYKEGFNYKYVDEKLINGEKAYIIDIFPENDDKDFSKMRLFIGKDNYMIIKAQTFGKGGNIYSIEVKSMKTDTNLSDSYFRFEPEDYPGVEVIDMR